MARCFPYDRSNYNCEDESLIASLKELQVQWGCTKPRKMVSQKKYGKLNKKRSREEDDKLDSMQHKNQKRKAEKDIKFNESSNYRWDRSDLAEELDTPAFVLDKSNSSGHTQNSSKRNSIHDADPNKTRPGMVIRIKLPSNKRKDPEPASASTDPCCSSPMAKKPKVQACLNETAPRCSSQVTKSSKITRSAAQSSSGITKSSRAQAFFTESASRCSSQATKLSKSESVSTESALRTKKFPSANRPLTIALPCFTVPVLKSPILQEGLDKANPSESRHKIAKARNSARR